MAKSGDQSSEPPETILTKFCMGDYVGNTTPHAKDNSIATMGASWQMREVLLSCMVFSFPLLWPQILLTSWAETGKPIFALFDSYDVDPSLLHSWRYKTPKCFFFLHFYPQKLPKRGLNRFFQASRVNYYNLHNMETAAPIPTKFCTVTKTTINALYGWSKQVFNKSKIADDGHLQNRKMAIFSPLVWPIGTKFGMVTHIGSMRRAKC